MNRTIEELFIELTNLLEKLELTSCSIDHYKYIGFSYIRNKYKAKNLIYYDCTYSNELIIIAHKEMQNQIISYTKYKFIRKCIFSLNELVETRSIQWKTLQTWKNLSISEYYLDIIKNYSNYEIKIQKISYKTTKAICGILYQFFEYLETININNLSKLTFKDVKSFLIFTTPRHSSGMGHVLYYLRKFNSFLVDNNINCIDISRVLPKICKKSRRIMPTFTKEDVQSILSACTKSAAHDKRSYAIFMLVKNSGLRVSDISNLKLTNINWYNNTIKIQQSKTQVELEIPFNNAVGNAIADYILNARPKNKNDNGYLFLRFRPPYQNIKISGIRWCLNKACKIANIKKIPGMGMHSFRRYVATQLLENNAKFDIIKEILGHSDLSSLKSYVRVDKTGLKICSLSFQGIEVKQKELI